MQPLKKRYREKGEDDNMYAYKNGIYTNDDCNIHKTVRLKPEIVEIIERSPGKNFTDKLQKIVKQYAENVAQNQSGICNTKI